MLSKINKHLKIHFDEFIDIASQSSPNPRRLGESFEKFLADQGLSWKCRTIIRSLGNGAKLLWAGENFKIYANI